MVYIKRPEAVALVKELGITELIQPTFVIIHERCPDRFQLKIKGNYDRKQIEIVLKNRNFLYEENNDYLIISKP